MVTILKYTVLALFRLWVVYICASISCFTTYFLFPVVVCTKLNQDGRSLFWGSCGICRILRQPQVWNWWFASETPVGGIATVSCDMISVTLPLQCHTVRRPLKFMVHTILHWKWHCRIVSTFGQVQVIKRYYTEKSAFEWQFPHDGKNSGWYTKKWGHRRTFSKEVQSYVGSLWFLCITLEFILRNPFRMDHEGVATYQDHQDGHKFTSRDCHQWWMSSAFCDNRAFQENSLQLE